jgi:tetratricopeptide (TPR) repeat protein
VLAGVARGDEPARSPGHAAEARELARTGIRLYEIGEYDDAIAQFKKSYAADPNPMILFNLAQAYRFKRDWTQAQRMYENYLRLMPHPPNRAVVQALIVEMKKKADEEELVDGHGKAARDNTPVIIMPAPDTTPQPVTPTPVPAPVVVAPDATKLIVVVPPPPRRPIYKRWWLWTAVGAGVAAVAVGLGVGLTQNHDYLPSGKLGTIDGR